MNRDVLLLVSSRVDDGTLRALSQARACDVSNQYFWYLRVQSLVGKSLRQRPNEDWKTAYYLLLPALRVEVSSPFTDEVVINRLAVDVLLELGYDPSANENYAINSAAYHGCIDVVQLLLADPRIDPSANENYAIKTATYSNDVELVKLLLADQRVSPEMNDDDLLKLAINISTTSIINLLLDDGRVDKKGEVVLREVNNTRGVYCSAIVRSKNLDLSKLSASVLTNIVSLDYGVRASISKSVELSENIETEESIMHRIVSPQSLYDELLRELIIKRRDLAYYLSWLNKKSDPVVRLASATHQRPIEHTSDLFTAYRAFFLVSEAWPATSQGVFYILSFEEVTQRGLSLAGTLIGAYLGTERK